MIEEIPLKSKVMTNNKTNKLFDSEVLKAIRHENNLEKEMFRRKRQKLDNNHIFSEYKTMRRQLNQLISYKNIIISLQKY